MAILNGFAALCFYGVFSYKNAKQKKGYCVQSHLTNRSRIKEPRTDSLWKRQILLGQVSLLSLSLINKYHDVFFVGKFLESFRFW